MGTANNHKKSVGVKVSSIDIYQAFEIADVWKVEQKMDGWNLQLLAVQNTGGYALNSTLCSELVKRGANSHAE